VSDKRGPAAVAANLYTETPESKTAREQDALARRLARPPGADLGARPTKQDRRRGRRCAAPTGTGTRNDAKLGSVEGNRHRTLYLIPSCRALTCCSRGSPDWSCRSSNKPRHRGRQAPVKGSRGLEPDPQPVVPIRMCARLPPFRDVDCLIRNRRVGHGRGARSTSRHQPRTARPRRRRWRRHLRRPSRTRSGRGPDGCGDAPHLVPF
jgi:hypothetical protein